jgi:hypothetical protein
MSVDRIFDLDLVTIGDGSMVTPWIAQPLQQMLPPITVLRDLDFTGRTILFVGNRLPCSSAENIRNVCSPSLYYPMVGLAGQRVFRLEKPIRARDQSWAEFALLLTKSLARPPLNWPTSRADMELVFPPTLMKYTNSLEQTQNRTTILPANINGFTAEISSQDRSP